MSRGINKAIIVGTLGHDPSLRSMPNGNAVVNFSVATNESWKDKQTDQQHEHTEWHNIVIFGKLAEIAKQYLVKGSQAYFEGKLKTEKWQDRTGNDRYTTKIIVSDMQMLGRKSEGAAHDNTDHRPKPEPGKSTAHGQAYRAATEGSAIPDNSAPVDDGFDDIPF